MISNQRRKSGSFSASIYYMKYIQYKIYNKTINAHIWQQTSLHEIWSRSNGRNQDRFHPQNIYLFIWCNDMIIAKYMKTTKTLHETWSRTNGGNQDSFQPRRQSRGPHSSVEADTEEDESFSGQKLRRKMFLLKAAVTKAWSEKDFRNGWILLKEILRRLTFMTRCMVI